MHSGWICDHRGSDIVTTLHYANCFPNRSMKQHLVSCACCCCHTCVLCAVWVCCIKPGLLLKIIFLKPPHQSHRLRDSLHIHLFRKPFQCKFTITSSSWKKHCDNAQERPDLSAYLSHKHCERPSLASKRESPTGWSQTSMHEPLQEPDSWMIMQVSGSAAVLM